MTESNPTYVTKRVCDYCGGRRYVHPSPPISHFGAILCPVCNGSGEIMEPAKQEVAPISISPEMEQAFRETARLLREALQVATPFLSSNVTITVDYAKWDTMNCVLGAIREKYTEWQNTDTSVKADEVVDEIDELLKKAGY
jgi:hypothetical protein